MVSEIVVQRFDGLVCCYNYLRTVLISTILIRYLCHLSVMIYSCNNLIEVMYDSLIILRLERETKDTESIDVWYVPREEY